MLHILTLLSLLHRQILMTKQISSILSKMRECKMKFIPFSCMAAPCQCSIGTCQNLPRKQQDEWSGHVLLICVHPKAWCTPQIRYVLCRTFFSVFATLFRESPRFPCPVLAENRICCHVTLTLLWSRTPKIVANLQLVSPMHFASILIEIQGDDVV